MLSRTGRLAGMVSVLAATLLFVNRADAAPSSVLACGDEPPSLCCVEASDCPNLPFYCCFFNSSGDPTWCGCLAEE